MITDRDIEIAVERMTDKLDKEFMRDGSSMTQEAYNARSDAIGAWAAAKFIEIRAAASIE